jgi:hypothetical protein
MHTLRLRSLPSIKEWRVYCLRYPLVEWVIYGMWAFVGFTALQNLWGGIELRWESSRFWFAADTADPWYELGTSLGFWGMLFMGLNFILAARWQWVEDLTGGLDRSYQLHAQVGTTALIFLILHLLVLAVQAIPDQQVLAQYLVPFVDTHYTLGMVGVIGLGLLVALTLWVKLPYRRWLQSHQLMGVPFLAGSLHAILLQTDWYLMAILGVGCYAWLYRLGLYRRWAPPSAGKLSLHNQGSQSCRSSWIARLRHSRDSLSFSTFDRQQPPSLTNPILFRSRRSSTLRQSAFRPKRWATTPDLCRACSQATWLPSRAPMGDSVHVVVWPAARCCGWLAGSV